MKTVPGAKFLYTYLAEIYFGNRLYLNLYICYLVFIYPQGLSFSPVPSLSLCVYDAHCLQRDLTRRVVFDSHSYIRTLCGSLYRGLSRSVQLSGVFSFGGSSIKKPVFELLKLSSLISRHKSPLARSAG